MPLSLVFFALGAIIASFVGLVVARLYSGASIAQGRSRCDACGSTLPALHLVPIFSWFWLRGRCGSCGSRVSPFSTLSEVILGSLYVLAYAKLGLTLALLFFLIALALLLAIVLYDLAHTIVPSVFLYPFLAVSICFALVANTSTATPLAILYVALGIGGSLLLLHLISRGRAMGFADAPLALGLSLLVGSAAFSGFIFSFWIGAVVGIIILSGRPRGHRMGIEVPFAPFLVAGFLLAYFTQWDPFVLIGMLLP